MSAAITIVRDLQSRGVQFWLDDDHVRFRGRGKPVNSKDVEYLKQHKGEVVEFLRSGLPCARHSAKSSASASGEIPVSAQLDRFQEKAAMLEKSDGLPRDQAVWLAALSAFVLPHERAEYFDGDNSLLPRLRHVCLAIGGELVVTFHRAGRVSFNRETDNGGT